MERERERDSWRALRREEGVWRREGGRKKKKRNKERYLSIEKMDKVSQSAKQEENSEIRSLISFLVKAKPNKKVKTWLRRFVTRTWNCNSVP